VAQPLPVASGAAPANDREQPAVNFRLSDHTVEIVSDAGEGAQTCGQAFGALSAKMGNGVWTVEIIPAEIEPPPRDAAGASGIRIRIGESEVTNWGDETKLVVALNEQALLGRHRLGALADDAIILLESMWEDHENPDIRAEWAAAMEELSGTNFRIIKVPMNQQCLTLVENPRRGKNMFVLGLLAWIYDRDMGRVQDQIRYAFRKKPDKVAESSIELMELGAAWAAAHLDFRFQVRPLARDEDRVVMNGNQALALGAVAAGLNLAAMYPITPATSVSHQLGEIFERFGGTLHQAEDEIAAAGVAIGASYAGNVAFTITSGPGLALKTEFLGLAVMAEVPLVVINVQRGGPSTGLPTKVEQSDLLAALFARPGDAPCIIMAPATIEECFHAPVTARHLAETFRAVVIILSDANLATGVQPFRRPEPLVSWQGSPPDMSPVPEGLRPYDWDPATGLSRRFIPGQPGGMHTVTGLTHNEFSRVAYDRDTNQRAADMRSRKLAVFQSTLQPPDIYGESEGELLVVGWGSTKGAIEEAIDTAGKEGLAVSSTHLTFLSPLQPGLKEMFSRFKRVMTVEINYSDDPDAPYITEENRRYGQLAMLLRAQTLVDVDCWTRVIGEPLRPGAILTAMKGRISKDEEGSR
jgi:2-oxoglutarate/2-oxoacid ferredoxin oxidoreductase subunit alpha